MTRLSWLVAMPLQLLWKVSKMFVACSLIVFLVVKVESVTQNVSCPAVPPREMDWKELDGKWYIAAVAADIQMHGDCAMVVYNHKTSNSTDVSIAWVTNNTVRFYNGTVSLIDDSSGLGDLLSITYTDHTNKLYTLLDVSYEHYAVLFACYNNSNGNSSTYEIWKLTRTPHLKNTDRVKLDQAVANYSLQNTDFLYFNNTEDTCRINGGTLINPTILTSIISTVVAISLCTPL